MKPLGKLRTKQLISALLVLILAVISTTQTDVLKRGVNTAKQTQPGLYTVEEVSDGDTIIVNMNGRREIIRMIGVDTPETVHPDRPVECFGEAASEYSRKLLENKSVRLEADPLNTNRDRFDRLLRHVYLPDGGLASARIIEDGYGFSYTLFPFEKKEQFNFLEQKAKAAGKGLWAACQVTVAANGAKKTNPAGPLR